MSESGMTKCGEWGMQVNRLAIAVLTPLISGATAFGAIAIHHHGLGTLLGLSQVHAAAESSPEPEALLANWPRQCIALQEALLKQPDVASVTYEARPIAPFVIPAWKLIWQGEVVALPLVDYDKVHLSRSEAGEVFVVLEDQQTETRVMLSQLKAARPISDVFAIEPHPTLALSLLQAEPAVTEAIAKQPNPLEEPPEISAEDRSKVASAKRSRSSREAENIQFKVSNSSWDGPSLTEHLFDGPVSLEQLLDIGYRYRPQALSCEANAWKRELPIAMGLALKLSTGTVPEAAYAKVGQQPGRVLMFRAEDKTTWQARFGAGESHGNVSIALPNEHESVGVGFGMGQENWWDSEPKPEWLIALERAVEADSVYGWQALVVELHRAGMVVESDLSIQALTTESDAAEE